jgi:hypothetical protein
MKAESVMEATMEATMEPTAVPHACRGRGDEREGHHPQKRETENLLHGQLSFSTGLYGRDDHAGGQAGCVIAIAFGRIHESHFLDPRTEGCAVV